MQMNDYQNEAKKTAHFPSLKLNDETISCIYPALGLGGEAGEVLEKIKKVLRDKGGKFEQEDIDAITKELGDVLWYVAIIASCLGISLEVVALNNVIKLRSRKDRGVIGGSGDDR